jgi:hypothetical protein
MEQWSAHTTPQCPQFVGSVESWASQPSAATPLQSAYPGLQMKPHCRLTHAELAFGGVEHVLPHPPQLLGSSVGSAQYGAPASSTHSTSGDPQVRPQLPIEHTSPGAQVLPHAPQLVVSVPRFVQYAPASEGHRVVSGPQSVEHEPLSQRRPVPHALPQPPQLTGSLFTSTHERPHRVDPPEQVKAQVPFEHTWPAVHEVTQAPQCVGSVDMLMQVPLQNVDPVGQPVVTSVAEEASISYDPPASVRAFWDRPPQAIPVLNARSRTAVRIVRR